MRVGAGDADAAGLQRLAQRFERGAVELRQLVEEQHALMRQADLAGPRAQAAADQRRQRGRMMRVAERPLAQQPAAAQPAGDRMDHADFERLGRFERRQDAGQPRRQHRLAGAGRADHQQIVPAGGGDFERALGALLALDVLEVEPGARGAAQAAARAAAAAGVPLKWLTIASRIGAAITSTSPAQAASPPHAAGQIRPLPRAAAAERRRAARRRPAVSEPSSASSPSAI